MKIEGIQHVAEQKRQQAKWNRCEAASVSTDPRIAHECEVTAKCLDEEAEQLERMAKGNHELIQNIEHLIRYLATSNDKSAQRTLAMRDLESASSRLRREVGYQFQQS